MSGAAHSVATRVAALLAARPWHVSVAALAGGLALSAGVRPGAIAAVALAVFGLLVACRAPAVGALAAALVLVGAAAGELRLEAIDSARARLTDGETTTLRAHLLTRPRRSAFGSSAEVRVKSGELSGARLLVRVAQWARFPERVPIGAELVLAGRLRAVEGSGERAAAVAESDLDFDFGAYLRRRGIAGELLLDRARATGAVRGGLAGLLDRMQVRAERAVADGMPPAEAALARGMVLGQDEAIAESVREDFRESGLAHLLAVSGQNVMLLVALAAAVPGGGRAQPARARRRPARPRGRLRARSRERGRRCSARG